ncbi:glycosyltransferase, group 2 family protein [Streptococcus cristatus ATCC 51100]|uniref:Glycosyltransferase, group 2 family protein n=1 Tax=Streptococcus cristatus ATCC 51100 TaxID=889201 RepID=A0AAV3EG03_STRCR|nr:glycosyltransferase family 2 protein [Streptococcus cristatus]EFX52317.1 glycosyltransferase, group 2 family protein [Streptococcus cristatus ATCC 51100]EGU68432.1 glycosyltransferase, group 2 family protein [Streptococcus cristatus ATCC 51100]KJQ60529.1 N-glycosyltransferase [Streptococcus cristatus]RSJ71974.1 N-glycosyltransferase [Streptococcus cristatus]SQG33153.1 rhamnosyl transferase [Streptococcus cristatus ATCC 51100]
MDKVCIVILNYNNCEDTIECVQSLRSAINSEKYKIVIVDNASTNDSVSKLNNILSPIEIIVSSENRGYAHGNNIGIKYAEQAGYEYICILNNDTIIDVDFIETCKNELKNSAQVAFVSPALVEYKDNNLIQSTGGDIFINKGIVTLKNHGARRIELPPKIESDYIGGACIMFRTSILKNIGYIPENYFLFFEETEWCYKAQKMGYKNICLTDSYIYHKGSVSIKSVSGLQEYLMARNRVVFVRRNIDSRIKYYCFLIYLFLQQGYHFLLRKNNAKNKIRYYLDGVFNRVDPSYPFIIVENE